MRPKPQAAFTPSNSLAKPGEAESIARFYKNQAVYSQGDPADAVFLIRKGKLKLTVISPGGKEAVIGILGAGEFFGEGCLIGQPLRMATATAMSECLIMRLSKTVMVKALRKEPDFSNVFLTYLLSRNIRLEEDLVDQIFNSSEKRLARVLLLLANLGKEGRQESVMLKINQETLASMVGTTRSRVNFFMNKFRRLGLIDYKGGLEVHSSLLDIILDDPQDPGSPTSSQRHSKKP